MTVIPPELKPLYPFTGKRFGTPEGNLHYVDQGSGEPIVMLHGNPTWSFFYREPILALQHNYRCLALDHLGCGLSDKPARAGYDLAGHIERALAWIESLGIDRFHLLVHDWGGAIGMGLAMRMPQAIGSLNILNTAAFPFASIPPRIALCRLPLLGRLAVRGANLFALAATRQTTVRPLSEAACAGYLLPYHNWATRVAVDAFVNDIPMRKSHPSYALLQAIGDSLPQWTRHPVQLVWGMQDWCFHTGILAEWRRRLPAATVHQLADASHYLIEDQPDTVIALIRAFLLAHPL